MQKLAQALFQDNAVQELFAAMEGGGCPAVLSGTGYIHRAHIIAALALKSGRGTVAVCADENEAKRLQADLSVLTGRDVLLLTSRDFIFYNAEGVSRQAEHSRIQTFFWLQQQRAPILVATIDGLMQRTIPPEVLKKAVFKLEMGKEADLNETAAKLVVAGYTRCEQVEGKGQFAIRGGILDFFSPSEEYPVRCEFFGDEIDSMGYFDGNSQRRIEVVQQALILPAEEMPVSLCEGGEQMLIKALAELRDQLLCKKSTRKELAENISRDIDRLKEQRSFPASDRYMDIMFPMACGADYIPCDASLILCEPKRIQERVKNTLWQQNEDCKALLENGIIDGNHARFYCTWDEMIEKITDFALIMMDNFTTSAYPVNPRTLLSVTAKQLPSYGGSLETAAGDIAHYKKAGFAVLVLCQDKRRAEILKEYLAGQQIDAQLNFDLGELPDRGNCALSIGMLSAGFEYPDIRLVVITEGQLSQPVLRRRPKKTVSGAREKIDSFTDLSPGDLVVHEHYGIGRFMGIVPKVIDKIEKDYVKIAYAGTDILYVPATQLDVVSKYIGSGENKPAKLSKMGGADWTRAKIRAKGAAKEMAQGLIQLQAERRRQKGYAFSPDNSWQVEFEESFPYQETGDQLRSIREIKKDMEQAIPMDRLLCGDVGYGKTEVALRAVMKCVMDGKQAAILVPTTVLAQQHYMTTIKRFSSFPVCVEVLSRFRTPAQMKQTIKNIADGTADIIIGTHRLLQKDLRFKDLGLLVVDEEQRFGVGHKERLKEMARKVDVLTLSATPIPRTLNMALSGIRDMSTIEEPPQDRQPVQTYVIEHDWGIICDAIRREIARGGQVYYLHNRVESINQAAGRLSRMLENINIGVAHGKMDEESLSDVMQQMVDGELSVLVCTTIIETGIDIPNVNTLIIEDADRLGLAQLHQLRGRVGRSSRRAFAYLTFRQGKVLTDVAEKRLSAIREFAEFNSGFKIAMRDLEIRGAGNILGAEQSGHMMNVGYDMYLKLLEEAVLEEKGEKVPQRTECSADLSISAHIPENYVPSSEQRIDLYRRIAHIRTEEDADDITDELIDRFGDPPRCVNTLIYIAVMRGEAESAGISEVSQKGGVLRFTLTDFQMEQISKLYNMPAYKGNLKIEAGKVPILALKLRSGRNPVEEARCFIRDYRVCAGADGETDDRKL